MSEGADYRYWKGWSDVEFAVSTASMSEYYRCEFARCGLSSLSGCRIVEIGFGNGGFAEWACAQKMVYSGTEIIAPLVEIGRARNFDMYPGDVPFESLFPEGSLDVVVAFDVFEHFQIDELHRTIRGIEKCLRSGALLMARVPSGDSPFSGAIQNGDLTHRTVLGSSAIGQLAAECGFEVLQVREPMLPLRGGGVISAVRRALVRMVRAIMYPAIVAFFMGGGRLVLTPNMVFLLRKP